ncbi:MAG: low molecular weight phosphatase family protein [Pseudomonadota bacterium]
MTQSILFACNMNSVRSPMAAALLRLRGKPDIHIDSAGVYEGGLDPFVEMVMQELGVSMESHEPKALSEVKLDGFDVIVALTPEAAVEARRYLPRDKIEFWDIENPSQERGGREAILEAYRGVRDDLAGRLRERFPELHEKP